MYLKNMRKDGSRVPQASIRRLIVKPGSSRVRVRELAEGNFELPRIDYENVNARNYRFAYGVGVRHPAPERLHRPGLEARHQARGAGALARAGHLSG